jgi:hypothetical protein
MDGNMESEGRDMEGEGQMGDDGMEGMDGQDEQMSGDFDVEAEMEAMAAEEAAAAAVAEEPEEEEIILPLVVSDAHSCFSLDKITEADDTLGEYNPRHLHCEFCDIIILLEGACVKVKKEVSA